MSIKATIIEFAKSLTPAFNTKAGVYEYEQDNIYPEQIKYFIDESITSHTASNLMTAYISGKNYDNPNFTKKQLEKLNEFKNKIAKSIADYKAVVIHVNRNLNGEITDFDVIPFHHARKGKKDDRSYNAKILTKTNWKDDKEKPLVFDVYNDDVNVITAQFNKQGENYKGQILYWQEDNSRIYPLSRLHPVRRDADTEIQISIYKNRNLRNEFFAKHIFITPPIIDSLVDAESDPEKFALQEQKRQEFKRNLQGFIGAKNVGNIMHFEMEFDNADEIDKVFVHKEIKPNINPDLFNNIEKSVMENIAMAYNNVPKLLIANPDTAMFSQSGESIRQAQLMYQNNTEKERKQVEMLVKKILSKSVEFKEFDATINPLIDVENGD